MGEVQRSLLLVVLGLALHAHLLQLGVEVGSQHKLHQVKERYPELRVENEHTRGATVCGSTYVWREVPLCEDKGKW